MEPMFVRFPVEVILCAFSIESVPPVPIPPVKLVYPLNPLYADIIEADDVPSIALLAIKSPRVTCPPEETVNLVYPEDEAVIKSPTPLLFTTSVAKEVLPDIEATERVPEKAESPVTLNLAEELLCPPTRKSRVELMVYRAPKL